MGALRDLLSTGLLGCSSQPGPPGTAAQQRFRQVRSPGSCYSQRSKVANPCGRTQQGRSGSPHLPRSHRYTGEPPNKDKHLPPPPPGRSTSLLVRACPRSYHTPSYHTPLHRQDSGQKPPPPLAAPTIRSTTPEDHPPPLDTERILSSVPLLYGTPQGSSNHSTAAGRWVNDQTRLSAPPASISVALRLQEEVQGEDGGASSPPSTKTRLPMGFKAWLKSPPTRRTPPKQEKDHINAVSKETGAPAEGREGVRGSFLQPHVHPGTEDVRQQTRRSSVLVSMSAPPKAHLNPAPGGGRATDGTQSFGSRQADASPSRQKSLEVPSGDRGPVHPPRSRVAHYGGTSPSNLQCLLLEMVQAGSEEMRADVCSATEALMGERGDPEPSREPAGPGLEQRNSGPACTIEEKVMLGIKEKECEEQDKMAARESRQRSGVSLVSWFGLRKSRLPALSGKKVQVNRTRDENKEVKTGAGRKEKRRSEKQQEAPGGARPYEMEAKLSTITDHCNNQVDQLAPMAFIELLARLCKAGCPRPTALHHPHHHRVFLQGLQTQLWNISSWDTCCQEARRPRPRCKEGSYQHLVHQDPSGACRPVSTFSLSLSVPDPPNDPEDQAGS